MPEDITLKHVGYRCDGMATIKLWGGGEGRVPMSLWDTDSCEKEDIVKGVNDDGFGCEAIVSAIVHVSDLYENGYKRYKEQINFNKEELKNTKKGI